jgi:hypothetical protein
LAPSCVAVSVDRNACIVGDSASKARMVEVKQVSPPPLSGVLVM